MNVPITQSKMWETLQNDLGETSFFSKTEDYQYLAILKKTPAGNYLYLPYGPVVDGERGFKKALNNLEELAKKHKAIFIRIEPQNNKLNLPKTAKKSHDLNPKETWLLDLEGNEADLKAKLPSRLLRYYNSAQKKGITIETSKNLDDIHYLLDLQKALAKEKGISTFSENYLKTELRQPFATLYLVRYNPVVNGEGNDSETNPESPLNEKRGGEVKVSESLSKTSSENRDSGEVVAAGLVFDDEKTRYNLQGAQSEQGRKLHATGILTIELILDAKAKNLTTFDFWGIAPENAPKDHPWAGFTNFKKTFAGAEKDYLGTYDLVLNPIKYKLYQALRKVNKILK